MFFFYPPRFELVFFFLFSSAHPERALSWESSQSKHGFVSHCVVQPSRETADPYRPSAHGFLRDGNSPLAILVSLSWATCCPLSYVIHYFSTGPSLLMEKTQFCEIALELWLPEMPPIPLPPLPHTPVSACTVMATSPDKIMVTIVILWPCYTSVCVYKSAFCHCADCHSTITDASSCCQITYFRHF